MPDAIIENPILNSPFEEPRRHFKFTDDGITNEILETRRSSGYFVPIPQPKKRGKQLELGSQWTKDRFRESQFINRVRDRVKVWREQGWPGVTNTTAARAGGSRLATRDVKRALRAEVDEAAWASLYSTVSRPFDPPETGKIAVKVINHYGDEVLKVFEVSGAGTSAAAARSRA